MTQPTDAGLRYLFRLAAEEKRAAEGRKHQRIAKTRGNELGKLQRDGHVVIDQANNPTLTEAGREIVRLARLGGK